MNKDPNVEKQIEELARSFCGLSKTLKCSECSYECYQKEYARKAFEAGYRKASEVAREIIQDIVNPIWRAYQNSESETTSLLAAFICECITTKIKKKYTELGNENTK